MSTDIQWRIHTGSCGATDPIEFPNFVLTFFELVVSDKCTSVFDSLNEPIVFALGLNKENRNASKTCKLRFDPYKKL